MSDPLSPSPLGHQQQQIAAAVSIGVGPVAADAEEDERVVSSVLEGGDGGGPGSVLMDAGNMSDWDQDV